MSSIREVLRSSFVDRPWKGDNRERVQALWKWRQEVRALFLSPARPEDRIVEDAGCNLRSGKQTGLVATPIDTRCLEAIRVSGSDYELLGRQWTALSEEAVLLRNDSELMLRDNLDALVGTFALLIAGVTGLKGTWRQIAICDCARAHHLAIKLFCIREDASAGMSCFPWSDLKHFGLSLSDLADGTDRPELKKLLWKQTVRIREALAGSLPLIRDLDRHNRSYMKRWWFQVLEVIMILEKSDYVVPLHDLEFKRSSRAQISFQSRFGRTTFR